MTLSHTHTNARAQINLILAHLGPMPPGDHPRERAMWVAALINPIPALGVSLEIRPVSIIVSSINQELVVFGV